MLVFDLETDGLLDNVTKVQCLNLIDRSTGSRERYTDHETYADGSPTPRSGSIADGLRRLASAPLAGQNIIRYDLPVLKKLFGFETKFPVFDTRVASAVIWTNLTDVDFGLLRAGKLPEEFQKKGLIGRQSLEAWGWRLGFNKGDFKPADFGYTWETCPFLREMDDYCAQDCEVTLKWIEKIEAKNYSAECLELEHRVAQIIFQQELNGFAFDEAAARVLYVELQKEKLKREQELQGIFPPWTVVTKDFIAKANNKKHGLVKGQRTIRTKEVIFNPGSRDHIAKCFKEKYGWRPSEFTDGGAPKIDEEVMASLPFPEAKPIAEFLTIVKRLGQLGDGKEGWLKAVRNGRIHGQVSSNGAVTGRMTHSKPNVAQADKWKPMRSLWIAPPGKVLVGCDAEGLELRMLAHYMAAYDGGAYARTVVEGKKEDGTDVHTVNQRAAGLNSRDSAKTFIYALLYGAGDYKLGKIIFDDFTEEQRQEFMKTARDKDRALTGLGKARRGRLMKNLPALAKLTEAVKTKAKATRTLKGLDGRILHVRSEHAALNTLLQSAGAVVMKLAAVILDDHINHTPELTGRVWLVASVHDEFQMETFGDIAEQLGRAAADSIRLAGEHFKLKCPLAGSYDVGDSWSATH